VLTPSGIGFEAGAMSKAVSCVDSGIEPYYKPTNYQMCIACYVVAELTIPIGNATHDRGCVLTDVYTNHPYVLLERQRLGISVDQLKKQNNENEDEEKFIMMPELYVN
jgi:hypothetical protein